MSKIELPFQYKLACCAIMYNEGKYLKEWLDYHLSIGIEKFYLYDNESTDDTLDVLKPYIECKQVEYTPFPGKSVQNQAYIDCLAKHRFDCEWIVFIDLDEFLHLLDGRTLYEILRDLRAKDVHMSGLAVQWKTFGYNGHEMQPSGGVIRNYTKRGARDNWSSNTIKTILNPRHVELYGCGAHTFAYIKPFHCVNENGQVVRCRYSNTYADQKVVAINHYITKSREEWIERRSHKTANGAQQRGVKDFDALQNYLNKIEDDGLRQFVIGFQDLVHNQ